MIEKILLGLFIVILFDNILMFVFCWFAERMDRRFFEKKSESKEEPKNLNVDNYEGKEESKKIVKVYNCLYSYMYGLMRYNLLLVGEIPSHRIRHFLYKYVYRMKLGKHTVIYGGCEIRSPWNIKIGNSIIAVGCLLDGRQGITIGDNVVFGSFVHVWTEEHDFNDPYFRVTDEHSQPVIIDDFVWVCSDSTILPGVHIKRGAVIAARAVATKDCEEFGVYGGVPAKYICKRNQNLKYELSGKPTWHFY